MSATISEAGSAANTSDLAVPEKEIHAATAYENLHVPALFQQWAPRLVEAAAIRPGQRVLDVACGTGVLAREAASRVGPDGLVSGVDISPGMLAVAKRLAPSIDWREGAAECLPYEDNTFDAVVSQFGLMFFQDRAAALREMLRVLAPGGRIAVAVWEALERSEAYPVAVELLERMVGREAAEALRAPFVLGEPAQLLSLFSDAGIASVELETRAGTAHFPGIRAMVEADLRGWLPVMGVFLDEKQIEDILAASEEALGQYLTPAGMVEFAAPAHIVAGTKP